MVTVGNVDAVVGIDGDGSVSSHTTCCVNGDFVPIACGCTTAWTGGILQIIIGMVTVGNVDAVVGIDGDGCVCSYSICCVNRHNVPVTCRCTTAWTGGILEVVIGYIPVRNVDAVVGIDGYGQGCSDMSCCVNGNIVPIACGCTTAWTGGILEVVIGCIPVGNVDAVVGIDGYGIVVSHITCCVNGNIVPIVCGGTTAWTDGVLQIIIGTVIVGNVDAVVGIDGDWSGISHITWCVNRSDNPGASLIGRILEGTIVIVTVGNVLEPIWINSDRCMVPNIAIWIESARWNRTAWIGRCGGWRHGRIVG